MAKAGAMEPKIDVLVPTVKFEPSKRAVLVVAINLPAMTSVPPL